MMTKERVILVRNRKLLVLLSLVLSISFVLAACGGSNGNDASTATSSPAASQGQASPEASASETPKEIVTLTLTVHASWVLPGYQAVIDLVNAKSAELGARIELEKIAEGDAGDQVIMTKFAAGEVPDILSFYDATYASKLGGAERFEDLSGDWTANYDGSQLAGPKYSQGGKLIMAPFGGLGGLFMFYNKKALEQAGATLPNNWQQFLAALDKLKTAGITPIYYSGKDAWTLQIIPLVGQTRDAKTDTAKFAEGLNANTMHYVDMKLLTDSIAKLKELKDKGYVNKTFLSDDYVSAQQALMDGTTGFYPMGSWVISDLNKLAPDKMGDIGAIGIPFDEGQIFSTGTPSGFFVPSGSKNKEAAKKVVAFMVSPEAQAAFYKAQPDIPFIKGIAPEGLFPPQNDIVKLFNEGTGYSNPVDFTVHKYGDFASYMQDVLVDGGKAPEEIPVLLDKDVAKAAKASSDPKWE